MTLDGKILFHTELKNLSLQLLKSFMTSLLGFFYNTGNDIFISDLLQAFQKLSYVQQGRMVKVVWDFKGWMENSLINSHGLGDQFEFRVHTVDKGYLNQYI